MNARTVPGPCGRASVRVKESTPQGRTTEMAGPRIAPQPELPEWAIQRARADVPVMRLAGGAGECRLRRTRVQDQVVRQRIGKISCKCAFRYGCLMLTSARPADHKGDATPKRCQFAPRFFSNVNLHTSPLSTAD